MMEEYYIREKKGIRNVPKAPEKEKEPLPKLSDLLSKQIEEQKEEINNLEKNLKETRLKYNMAYYGIIGFGLYKYFIRFFK